MCVFRLQLVVVSQKLKVVYNVNGFTDPINRLAAAVSNANSNKTTSNSFSKERHVTPALQFVPGQPDPIQLVW